MSDSLELTVTSWLLQLMPMFARPHNCQIVKWWQIDYNDSLDQWLQHVGKICRNISLFVGCIESNYSKTWQENRHSFDNIVGTLKARIAQRRYFALWWSTQFYIFSLGFRQRLMISIRERIDGIANEYTLTVTYTRCLLIARDVARIDFIQKRRFLCINNLVKAGHGNLSTRSYSIHLVTFVLVCETSIATVFGIKYIFYIRHITRFGRKILRQM
jgi:hypothetical protein